MAWDFEALFAINKFTSINNRVRPRAYLDTQCPPDWYQLTVLASNIVHLPNPASCGPASVSLASQTLNPSTKIPEAVQVMITMYNWTLVREGKPP